MRKSKFRNGLICMLAITLFSCSSDNSNGNDACADATTLATNALNNAINLQTQASCNLYVAALENKKTACPDEAVDIQSIIDGLGDCSAGVGSGTGTGTGTGSGSGSGSGSSTGTGSGSGRLQIIK